MDADVAEWIQKARHARHMCSTDGARFYYQKAAYSFTRLSLDEREAIKQEIAEFAKSDPVYISNIESFRRVLGTNAGVLQSDLIRGCVTGSSSYASEEAIREVAGYVLYYAEVLGDLVRVKSGRSYKLYLPGQEVLIEASKSRSLKTNNQ